MKNINLKKILTSVFTIGVVAVVALVATQAFFSDTETSVGNVLQAGAIDLGIDNHSYYNGVLNPGTTWRVDYDLSDQEPRQFFNFTDVKPGDWGEDTISIHVKDNDAYVCADVTLTSDDDNSLTDPESDDGDLTGGVGEGELADAVNFYWWADDGDNVFEVEEVLLPAGPMGALSVGQTATVALADTQTNIWGDLDNVNGNGAPLPGDTVRYVAKAWCFGDTTMTPYPQDGGNQQSGPDIRPVSCDGASVNNVTQTDSFTADISFRAVQSRNNEQFVCRPPEPQQPLVGAALGDYTQPTGDACNVNVTDIGGDGEIQVGVNAATEGQTVCVGPGTYNENVTITTPGVTLAGDGATATSTINGRVRVGATGVTVKGFNILGASVPAEGVNGVYVVGGSNNLTLSDNVIDGDSHASGLRIGVHFEVGGTTGAVITNNVIRNWDSTGLYINPTAGPLSITYNDFLANNVAIGSSSPTNVTVSNNDFVGNIAEAIGMDDSAGATSGIAIHVNNFTPSGAGNDVNSYGTTPASATNNWWDTDAAGARTNDQVDIDVTLPAGSAFAQN